MSERVVTGSYEHDVRYLHQPSEGMSRLKRCPVCDKEFGYNAGPVRDRHFLNDHGPADFGLEPLQDTSLSDAERRIKTWLYQQYWDQTRSITEIADQLTVHTSTVRKKMRRLGIPRRPPNAQRPDVPDWLGFYDDNAAMPEVDGDD